MVYWLWLSAAGIFFQFRRFSLLHNICSSSDEAVLLCSVIYSLFTGLLWYAEVLEGGFKSTLEAFLLTASEAFSKIFFGKRSSGSLVTWPVAVAALEEYVCYAFILFCNSSVILLCNTFMLGIFV